MNANIELITAKSELALKHFGIKENQVLDLLGNELPELNSELEKLPDPQNIYVSVKCFAEFTMSLIKSGKLLEVKGCFNLAERLLMEGNKSVKNAIENVYVYSVSSLIDFSSPLSNKIKAIMNKGLITEYKRQIYTSGI